MSGVMSAQTGRTAKAGATHEPYPRVSRMFVSTGDQKPPAIPWKKKTRESLVMGGSPRRRG